MIKRLVFFLADVKVADYFLSLITVICYNIKIVSTYLLHDTHLMKLQKFNKQTFYRRRLRDFRLIFTLLKKSSYTHTQM